MVHNIDVGGEFSLAIETDGDYHQDKLCWESRSFCLPEKNVPFPARAGSPLRNMSADWELLEAYARSKAEDSFKELVERHIGLVFSCALRQLNGDAQLAQDVAQTVFTDLARKAGSLPKSVVLPGWLYRHTCFTARKLLRGESRRRSRERLAHEMLSEHSEPAPAIQELTALVDQHLLRLGALDRDAIILRYLEGRDFAFVASVQGTSEEAAKKRVSRALERLRSSFKRRGVDTSVGALTALLLAEGKSTVAQAMTHQIQWAALLQATPHSLSGTSWWANSWASFKVAGFSGAILVAIAIAGLLLFPRRFRKDDPISISLLGLTGTNPGNVTASFLVTNNLGQKMEFFGQSIRIRLSEGNTPTRGMVFDGNGYWLQPHGTKRFPVPVPIEAKNVPWRISVRAVWPRSSRQLLVDNELNRVRQLLKLPPIVTDVLLESPWYPPVENQ